jgi:hypothetical protein
MPRTLHSMAQEALDVQSACNLSGVIAAFARIVTDMRGPLGMDTPTCNTHPICRLFAEQIAHLTGGGSCENVESYWQAHRECERLAAMDRSVRPNTWMLDPEPDVNRIDRILEDRAAGAEDRE